MVETLQSPQVPEVALQQPKQSEQPIPSEGRQLRVHAMERVMGVDENGNKQVGQIFRDAVADRITHPEDTSKTRVLSRRHIFTELSGAANGVDQILTAHSTNPMDNAALAKLLRPRLDAIYTNRKGGKDVLATLTDEEVIADAKDFAGTTARELFLGEYLDRVGRELSIKNEITEMCNQDIDTRINRGNLFKKVREFMKARTRTGREVGRVASRLKLGKDEKDSLRDAFRAQYPQSIAEYTPDERAIVDEASRVKMGLEKKVLRDVTGDTEDPALSDATPDVDSTKYPQLLANLRKKEDLFNEAALAQVEYSKRRQHLAEACQSLNPGRIANAFNQMRRSELYYKVERNGIKTVQKREARRFRLLGIAEDGEKRLATAEGILLGSPTNTYAKSLTAEIQALPGTVMDATKQGLEKAGHSMAEAGERPMNALKRGILRVTTMIDSKAEAQVDRVAGFTRNVAREFHAWRGQPDIHGKMARSAAYFAYGNTGDMADMQSLQEEIAAVEQEVRAEENASSVSEPQELNPITPLSSSEIPLPNEEAGEVQIDENRQEEHTVQNHDQEQQSNSQTQKRRFGLPFSLTNIFRRRSGQEQKPTQEQSQLEQTNPSESTDELPQAHDEIDTTAVIPHDPTEHVYDVTDPIVSSDSGSVEFPSTADEHNIEIPTPNQQEQPEEVTVSSEAQSTVVPIESEKTESTENLSEEDLVKRFWTRFEANGEDIEAEKAAMKKALEQSLEQGKLEVALSTEDTVTDFHKEKTAAFRELAQELGLTLGEPSYDAGTKLVTVEVTKPTSGEPSEEDASSGEPTDSTPAGTSIEETTRVVEPEQVSPDGTIPTLEHPTSDLSSDSVAETNDEETVEPPPAPTPIPVDETPAASESEAAVEAVEVEASPVEEVQGNITAGPQPATEPSLEGLNQMEIPENVENELPVAQTHENEGENTEAQPGEGERLEAVMPVSDGSSEQRTDEERQKMMTELELAIYDDLVGNVLRRGHAALLESKVDSSITDTIAKAMEQFTQPGVREQIKTQGLRQILKYNTGQKDENGQPIVIELPYFLEMAQALRERSKTQKRDSAKSDISASNILGGLVVH